MLGPRVRPRHTRPPEHARTGGMLQRVTGATVGTGMLETVKRIFVGRPLATSEQEHQRLTKTVALAVFSSDAISSTAYATEEILFVTAAGTASSLQLGLDHLVPIAIGVAVLLAIVVTSYRQTIYAYPRAAAAYIVSRENHGEMPALVAGASILVDYILTVAVSVSAGVAAIISIPQFQSVAKHRVAVALVIIVLISLANLRGIKESGRLFAIPTYGYIVMVGAARPARAHQELLRLVRRHQSGAVRPRASARCCARPAARSASSSSSRASRRARSRSPASKRSPTACPRSAGRRRRTRRRRSR